jgi:zinc transporter
VTDDLGDGIGYAIRDGGRAERFPWLEQSAPADAPFVWLHLDLTSEATRAWLTTDSGLDPLVVDALLEEETRPRSVPMGDGLLVILRGVNLNPGADPEDMVSLRIFAEASRVISGRRRPLMAVRDVRALVDAGKGPTSTGEFLADVAGRLVERMGGVITELNERVDEIEESLADAPLHAQRSALTAIRRQAIALRRYLAPQREALARLHGERVAWLSDTQRMQLREVTDTTLRYVEDLEAARERTAITQEELNGRLSEQMNRRMYALSIIAGIFLPLSFATGLLGINVGGIPGSEDPKAFALVCGALAALGVAQIAVFRLLGWLGRD